MQAALTKSELQKPDGRMPATGRPLRPEPLSNPTAFGSPRDFLDNRFVYVTLSARARGLSIGVNLNPDQQCNFDCVYCEVDRRSPSAAQALDLSVMDEELRRTLALIHSGEIRRRAAFRSLPAELLKPRQVAMSGDGEPTLCPQFAGAVQTVVHVRAGGRFPFFKIVLLTNATGLDLPQVEHSLKLLTDVDEIWAKLDAGTQAFMDQVNRPRLPMSTVMANIVKLGRQRPVIIQSMFSQFHGQEPSGEELAQYLERLRELKAAGAEISLVQICSPTRPFAHAGCGHLPLKSLSQIAKLVRTATGLRAEVF